MNVVIGIDPHKASHTAVAIDDAEDEISSVKVRATRRQVEQLVRWAEPFEKRRWAIESAGGTGYLLAQQLVAQGEEVLDVPATLASRIRVLATGRSNKNDANDAHSIAVAAFRAPSLAASRWLTTPRSSASWPSAMSTSATIELGSCVDSMPSWPS
jgi:transposase